MSSGNVVYYNANITHDSNYNIDQDSPAVLNDLRTDTILPVSSDYVGSIIRFKIAGLNIPIQVWPIQPNQPDINLSTYSFTMSYYNSSTSTYTYHREFVEYLPLYPSVPAPSSPVGNAQDNTQGYYFVYDYDHIVTMFNATLIKCLNALKTIVGSALNDALYPFYVWNPMTSLVSIYFNTASIPTWDNGAIGTDTLNLYFNNQMIRMMHSFYYSNLGINQPNGTDNLCIVESNVFDVTIGSQTFINYIQQYNSIDYWNSFNNILIQSNMPITQEASAPLGQQQTQSQNTNTNSYTVGILTDFIPDLNNMAGGQSNKFIYNAVFPYRVFEFSSNLPLKQISLQIYWTDIDNNSYPLLLTSHTNCSFKFMFIKKDYYYSNLNNNIRKF